MKLLDQISGNETVIWHGKKEKGVSVLESIFNPLLPFAIIWGVFDVSFIYGFSLAENHTAGGLGGAAIGIAAFFLLHLMPVWLYFGGILTAALRAKHTEYAVTDKAVYIQKGVFSTRVEMKPLTEIADVKVYQGMFDKMYGTGDLIFNVKQEQVQYSRRSGRVPAFTVSNIREYERVFQLIRDRRDVLNAGSVFTGIPQSTGQPARVQPVFSDPQLGFDAVRGAFSAGSTMQPQIYGQPQIFAVRPEHYGEPPVTPSLPPRDPVMPQDAFLKPLDFAQPNAAPQSRPAQQTQFALPEMDGGFDLPEPGDSFSDPACPQTDAFRDPTLEYFEREQQNDSF